MSAVRRMKFDEFGHAFLDLVVTDVVLGDAINQSLSAPPPGSDVAAGGLVVVRHKATLERAKVTGDAHKGFLVEIPIEMTLALTGLLNEVYAVATRVQFTLGVETWTPLEIRISYQPVVPESIVLEVEWKAGIPVSDWLMKQGKEDEIKKTLAEQVNKALEGSEKARRIDLLSMVKQALAGGGKAGGGGGGPAGGGSASAAGTWDDPIPIDLGARMKGTYEGVDGLHLVIDVPEGATRNVNFHVRGPDDKVLDIDVLDLDRINLDANGLRLEDNRGDWNVRNDHFGNREARRRIIRYRPREAQAIRLEYLIVVTD